VAADRTTPGDIGPSDPQKPATPPQPDEAESVPPQADEAGQGSQAAEIPPSDGESKGTKKVRKRLVQQMQIRLSRSHWEAARRLLRRKDS